MPASAVSSATDSGVGWWWCRGILAAGCLALGLLLSGCGEGAPEPLRVAVCPVTDSAALHLVRTGGAYPDAGLVYTYHETGRECLAALLAGEADLATVADTPLVLALLEGHRPHIVATLATHPGMVSLIADAGQGIATVDDLIGKRVAFPEGTSAGYFLHSLESYHWTDSGAIEDVALAPQQAVEALATGDVAAIAAWSPLREQAVAALGERAVVIDHAGSYIGTWNLVATGAVADDPRVCRFLAALIEVSATRLTAPDPATVATLAEWTGMEAQVMVPQLDRLRFDPRLDQSLLLLMEDQARWQQPGGEHLEILEAIDTRCIHRIDPARVTFID